MYSQDRIILMEWNYQYRKKPYFSSGYRFSLSGMPSSSRMGSSSWRYSSYWPLFSTLNLMPVWLC